MKVFLVFIAYLIGSIPTGYWLGMAWKGIDVRRQGSGNLGATNVFRVLGKGPGFVTLALDILKGAFPVMWVQHRYPGELVMALSVGVAAIIGHTTSVFVNFRGGKGVATSAGVFAALLPVPFLIALTTFGVALATTRMVSLSSMLSALVLAGTAWAMSAPRSLSWVTLAMAALVIWKHRSNLKRLLNGTEPKI